MYHTISRNIQKVEGVLIQSVANGTPAYNAGLRSGDIITHCNNQLVGKNNNQQPLGTLLHFATVGSNLTLRVLKAPNFAARTVTVRSIRLPGQYDYIFSNKFNIEKLEKGKHTIHT
jgi:S1-C subfamily serine protease